MQLPSDNCGLVIVDMQVEGCERHGPGVEPVVENIRSLLDRFRNVGGKVVHIQSVRSKDHPEFTVFGKEYALLEGTPGVDFVAQLIPRAITIPVSMARSFLAPPKTDPKALAILQKAFKQTVESEAYVSRATNLNFPVEYIGPEETKALYLKVLDISPTSAAMLEKVMGISK